MLFKHVRLCLLVTAVACFQQHGVLRRSSDLKPVQISTEEVVPEPDVVPEDDLAAVIVGGGRIGGLLSSLNPNDALMTRESGWPADAPTEGPIYVRFIAYVKLSEKSSVIEATPQDRRDDLVFLQNGMLGPYLESKGLAHCTQSLVYFAVSKLGDPPIDGITALNPDGLTTATGKWASAFKARLAKAGLRCHVAYGDDFTRAMLEKHIWICSFMLVGAYHGGITVGEVEEKHREQLDVLVEEMVVTGQEALTIQLSSGYLDRLCAYARAVSHFPTAVKEFRWRNGWFYKLTYDALDQGKSDPLPLHTDMLYALYPPFKITY